MNPESIPWERIVKFLLPADWCSLRLVCKLAQMAVKTGPLSRNFVRALAATDDPRLTVQERHCCVMGAKLCVLTGRVQPKAVRPRLVNVEAADGGLRRALRERARQSLSARHEEWRGIFLTCGKLKDLPTSASARCADAALKAATALRSWRAGHVHKLAAMWRCRLWEREASRRGPKLPCGGLLRQIVLQGTQTDNGHAWMPRGTLWIRAWCNCAQHRAECRAGIPNSISHTIAFVLPSGIALPGLCCTNAVADTLETAFKPESISGTLALASGSATCRCAICGCPLRRTKSINAGVGRKCLCID